MMRKRMILKFKKRLRMVHLIRTTKVKIGNQVMNIQVVKILKKENRIRKSRLPGNKRKYQRLHFLFGENNVNVRRISIGKMQILKLLHLATQAMMIVLRIVMAKASSEAYGMASKNSLCRPQASQSALSVTHYQLLRKDKKRLNS